LKRARFTGCADHCGFEQAAGAKPADLARKHGVLKMTLCIAGGAVMAAWTFPKRMKQLEDEKAKLKKLPAEELLEVARLG
jgi:putative transposase